MPDFDGENLIITLDPVVDGVLDVDVQENLYEPWKDWMLSLSQNRAYPAAFRSDGGGPLSAIINQGSYFFLNNIAGWRIKPFESDGTWFLTGNLAVENTALPAFVPTVGAFTAAILGLQPITQGVTPAMGKQLEFISFDGHIAVDAINGYPGQGYINGSPIGTLKTPSDNMTDTLAIAVREGLGDITFHSNMAISLLDFSAGYNFSASSPTKLITVNPSADVSNCSFRDMRITGDLDGFNLVERSSVESCSNMSGFAFTCSFKGANSLSGNMQVIDCQSGESDDGKPSFDIGPYTIQTTKWSKSIEIKNAQAGGGSSIEVSSGRVYFDSTCVGSTINVRGFPYEIIDNSGSGCLVRIETESAKVNDMWQFQGLDPENPANITDTGSGHIVDVDGKILTITATGMTRT